MTPPIPVAFGTPRLDRQQLSGTRRPHLCPRCYHYAYHAGQTAVRVGARVHHSACPTLRSASHHTAPPKLPPPVLVGADSDAAPADAPQMWPILVTSVGLVVATLRYVRAPIHALRDKSRP